MKHIKNGVVGIGMITLERIEHFQKHGRTVRSDVMQNQRCELAHAARELTLLHLDPDTPPPFGWDQSTWNRMASKPYLERLVIAGALIAAEVDRVLWLDAIGNDNYNIDDVPDIPEVEALDYDPDKDETKPTTT